MAKVLLITNIPAPYRLDLFYYMQTHIKEHEFHVLYCAERESNRCWNVDKEKISNTYFLQNKEIAIKNKYDTKYIHIPMGVTEKLKQINPDVVIGWEYNPISLVAIAWCKLHKRKYINLTDGTLYSERNINFVQKVNRKIIAKGCDAAIASSTKAKEKLEAWNVSDKKIFISLLTVDTSVYSKAVRKPIEGRLLYVGSMIERKGLDLLISALGYVKEEFCLHIVGNGTEDEIQTLKKQIEKANLAGTVEFCGFKQGKDLLEEYQCASAFILPTREDCFGLVLLEAACMGTPVITSKYADGAYDIITENVNGAIIDPYNAEEFGKTISNVLQNTGKFKVDENIYEKFSFKSVSKGYTDAIEYVLNEECR